MSSSSENTTTFEAITSRCRPASVITATMAPIASDTSVSVTPAMGPIAEITASGRDWASAAAIAARVARVAEGDPCLGHRRGIGSLTQERGHLVTAFHGQRHQQPAGPSRGSEHRDPHGRHCT